MLWNFLEFSQSLLFALLHVLHNVLLSFDNEHLTLQKAGALQQQPGETDRWSKRWRRNKVGRLLMRRFTLSVKVYIKFLQQFRKDCFSAVALLLASHGGAAQLNKSYLGLDWNSTVVLKALQKTGQNKLKWCSDCSSSSGRWLEEHTSLCWGLGIKPPTLWVVQQIIWYHQSTSYQWLSGDSYG